MIKIHYDTILGTVQTDIIRRDTIWCDVWCDGDMM